MMQDKLGGDNIENGCERDAWGRAHTRAWGGRFVTRRNVGGM